MLDGHIEVDIADRIPGDMVKVKVGWPYNRNNRWRMQCPWYRLDHVLDIDLVYYKCNIDGERLYDSPNRIATSFYLNYTSIETVLRKV